MKFREACFDRKHDGDHRNGLTGPRAVVNRPVPASHHPVQAGNAAASGAFRAPLSVRSSESRNRLSARE